MTESSEASGATAHRSWLARPAVLALCAALVGGGLYFMARDRVKPSGSATATAPAASAASAASPRSLSASQVENMIATTKAELGRDPANPSRWAMLAHSYEMIGDFERAGQAYQKLLELAPRDAQAHADYADALGVAHQGSLQGEAIRLIDKALTLDPRNLKALVLAGKAAFEAKRYDDATRHWELALAESKDAAMSRQIEISVAEARALSPKSAGKPASAPSALAFVAGRVSVDPRLAKQLSPDDTVFIFARPVEGSRMPVAMLRKHVRDLPIDFALDDSLSMVATNKLSRFDRVTIGARVSHRGDVIPAAGDLQGLVGPVALGTTGLKVEINDVVK